jgi:hypothetical protein
LAEFLPRPLRIPDYLIATEPITLSARLANRASVARRLREWLRRKHGSRSGKFHRWPNPLPFGTYGLHELPVSQA